MASRSVAEGVAEGGLSAKEAVTVMVEQLALGTDEIEVMTEAESQMLTAKKSDPTSLFRMLEGMAEKELTLTSSYFFQSIN